MQLHRHSDPLGTEGTTERVLLVAVPCAPARGTMGRMRVHSAAAADFQVACTSRLRSRRPRLMLRATFCTIILLRISRERNQCHEGGRRAWEA